MRHEAVQHLAPLEESEVESKINILLVDDRSSNLDALEEALSELGENLVRAESGKEALIQLLDKDFAVVLLDVQMPVLDGYETADLIRKRGKTAKVPIIFVTAFDQDSLTILKGYETGAVDYITKPYNADILRSKVKVFVDLFRMREEIHSQQIMRSTLESKTLEHELERAHNLKLQALVADLERSNRELDNFAYVASHDLKEPLRGIAINADLLLREKVSTAGKQRVERMVELTTRMEQLISDLLFFSRLGRGDLSQEDIDPSKIITSVKQELRETLELTHGSILVETELPLVHVDKTKIKIIFQNLIANALKYNDAQNRLVKIGYQRNIEIDGKQLENVFYVQDNGIGIDKKNHEKVFRIFTRLNREKDYGKGTGAGLSFVSRIIEEYGNTPVIASQLGQGTTFYFSLPMVGSHQEMALNK